MTPAQQVFPANPLLVPSSPAIVAVTLCRGPSSQETCIRLDSFGVLAGQVILLVSVADQVEQPRPAGFEFMNHLPAAIGDAEQFEDGRHGVRQTGDSADAPPALEQSWSSNQKRDADVLLVEKECVPEVARMLAERLAVVAAQDEQRRALQPASPQAGEELSHGGIGVMQGVAIAVDRWLVGERPRAGWRGIRMMTRNRQVADEELIPGRLVEPVQDAADSGLLVDAKARVVIAADGTGVLTGRESACAYHRIHSQVGEPP